MTQSNHELNQLKLGQVLLPSGPLTRIECRLAVVEIQKHVNDGVQSQWYRDGRPIAVNGSVFTQHQNGRVVVNLRGNKFKNLLFFTLLRSKSKHPLTKGFYLPNSIIKKYNERYLLIELLFFPPKSKKKVVPVYALADHCLLLGTRPSLHHAPANFSLQLSLRGGAEADGKTGKDAILPSFPW